MYLTLGENADETKECAKQIKELSSELKDNKSKLSEAEGAADELDETLDDVGDSAREADDGFTVWKATLADLASNAIQSVISKVGELAQKIGELVTTAVSDYADYEQLVGGVETLFGDSADTLIGYAETAYKTAGLSANDYMETATSFAASLIQGLGDDTAQAVELTDLAITDMSDNANKMGTDMESIQNAYQGFA
ncbi:MAG: PblA, partial [Clostridiales bacterium]|nr:PblA [Clostridiales bacterium]